MKFIAIIALIAIVFADPVPYKLCDTGIVDIKGLDVTPYPVLAGQNVTITASGTIAEKVTAANYEIAVKVLGIKLIDLKGDLCTLSPSFSCPHDSGDLSIEQHIAVPGIAPKGTYDISLKATDQSGKVLFCAEANVKIEHAKESMDTLVDPEFEMFVQKFGKSYSSDEEKYVRASIFRNNVKTINEHNAKGLSWTLAINEYADLTWAEFRENKLGYAKRTPEVTREVVNFSGAFTLPNEVDWRTKNAVTPVKNQEQCGSCWAFSTTGSVEGAVAIKTGKLTSVSEQQLVDCSGAEGNMGCNGGLMDNAFKYIIQNGGICSEASYPYTASDGTCHTCTPVSKIAKYVDVEQNDSNALKAAVALQPVSVAIEADQSGFQFYSSGVFTGTCGTALDHGVLAVGYGTLSGQDYWIVKNSWGANWGDNGYILLARTSEAGAGQCGIAMEPSYPIAA